MMRRRDFLSAAGAAATWCLAGRPARAAETKARPNFLWILSEDNSTHYMKLFDPDGAPAPTIEALAKAGIVFTRAFSNAPVCSAARTTLMTGVLGPRIASHYHRKIKMTHLPGALRMFPAYLRKAGYYTTNKQKKDYNCVEGQGVWDESSRKASWRKRPAKDAPFFHMESTGVSHEGRLHFTKAQMAAGGLKTDPKKVKIFPFHPDTPTFRYTCARYHDCMAAIDQQVARIVGDLKEDGLLEDTFIFYFGDHGGVLPGSKGYLWETGLHVPLVVRVPEKFRHLVPMEVPVRSGAFVSFVDFGPTLLKLAGLAVPKEMDGKPFLGAGVTEADLARRDEAYGYADRFDEKYEMVRSLRKGRVKYMRFYQAYYPDGLQNNYRYRQLAYQEWRALYKAGKLNADQRRFFEPKPAEALYDLQTDPYEIHNLAGDPKQAETLAKMRSLLQAREKGLPDLSFYPESYLIDNALDAPADFGQAHKAEIARLVDVADLALLPFAEAKDKLAAAMALDNQWDRYWALTACSCFGAKAKSLAATAKPLLKDKALLVRVRAAEFLAILGAADPRPALYEVLNTTKSPAEALLTLNAAVFVNDHLKGYPFDIKQVKLKVKQGEVSRRMEYLRGK